MVMMVVMMAVMMMVETQQKELFHGSFIAGQALF